MAGKEFYRDHVTKQSARGKRKAAKNLVYLCDGYIYDKAVLHIILIWSVRTFALFAEAILWPASCGYLCTFRCPLISESSNKSLHINSLPVTKDYSLSVTKD